MTDAIKTSSKTVIQNTAEATGNLIGKRSAKKSQMFQQTQNKILQRQLQMSIIKK